MENKSYNGENNFKEMKTIRFFFENGTMLYLATEEPEELVIGDIWLDPNDDEWARINYEFYNKVQSYDNRLY